ncbi:hypothetical protein IHE45_16G078500 [Dioscorea alata]|uniref:Uncharacterized protein n=1 Tax=Dioscorea alata TaxID=55571 RepID=A0ACB7UIP2_DIOAL|nr:hypothetical protein IHE45_16G078500 [Dioscorea alata]
MRTPMRDRAWAPISPPRDWKDRNPASSGSTPQYQPVTHAQPDEPLAPDSRRASTRRGNYSGSPTLT